MDIKERLLDWGINAVALLAGLMGGLISITMNDKQISFRSALSQMITAAAFSGYGTALLAKWLGLTDHPSMCGVIGLCLGICGMYVARGVIKIGKKFESNPTTFIKKGGSDDLAAN